MRKYTQVFNPQTRPGNNRSIACPFPGKHPLRFNYIIFSDNFNLEGSARFTYLSDYCGKLTQSAWKKFTRTFKKLRQTKLGVTATWYLYDRGTVIACGTDGRIARNNLNVTANVWFRYFIRPISHSSGDPLGKLLPTKLGRYWIYSADGVALSNAQARLKEYELDRVPTMRRVSL